MKFKGMKIIMLLLITALLLGASYAAEDNGTADTLTVLDETSVYSLEVEECTVYDSLSVDDEVQLESSDMDEIMTHAFDFLYFYRKTPAIRFPITKPSRIQVCFHGKNNLIFWR